MSFAYLAWLCVCMHTKAKVKQEIHQTRRATAETEEERVAPRHATQWGNLFLWLLFLFFIYLRALLIGLTAGVCLASPPECVCVCVAIWWRFMPLQISSKLPTWQGARFECLIVCACHKNNADLYSFLHAWAIHFKYPTPKSISELNVFICYLSSFKLSKLYSIFTKSSTKLSTIKSLSYMLYNFTFHLWPSSTYILMSLDSCTNYSHGRRAKEGGQAALVGAMPTVIRSLIWFSFLCFRCVFL